LTLNLIKEMEKKSNCCHEDLDFENEEITLTEKKLILKLVREVPKVKL
jgi:hypothetical protein